MCLPAITLSRAWFHKTVLKKDSRFYTPFCPRLTSILGYRTTDQAPPLNSDTVLTELSRSLSGNQEAGDPHRLFVPRGTTHPPLVTLALVRTLFYLPERMHCPTITNRSCLDRGGLVRHGGFQRRWCGRRQNADCLLGVRCCPRRRGRAAKNLDGTLHFSPSVVIELLVRPLIVQGDKEKFKASERRTRGECDKGGPGER